MKVIFLDIDGVLNTSHSMKLAQEGIAPQENRPWLTMDPTPVALLDDLITKTGAKIVVSSSWRQGSLERSKDVFIALKWAKFQASDSLIDVTPRGIKFDGRGEEIRHWLDSRPEVTKFVIIDDDSFDITTIFPLHLVKCDTKIGLTQELANRCLALLGD